MSTILETPCRISKVDLLEISEKNLKIQTLQIILDKAVIQFKILDGFYQQWRKSGQIAVFFASWLLLDLFFKEMTTRKKKVKTQMKLPDSNLCHSLFHALKPKLSYKRLQLFTVNH